MAEPSLSELSNLSADPERGTGTPAYVIDTSKVVSATQEAARLKMENDWRKYTYFQENLKELYKNAQDIESQEMAPQDREALQERLGNVFNQIAEDPQAYLGGKKRAEIEKQLGQIRGDATLSKQDLMFDKAHREFLTVNPGWATKDNLSKVNGYLNQPLGKRQQFSFQPAPSVDFDTMATSINGIVGRNFSNETFTGIDKQGRPVAGEDYVMKVKGKTYDTNRYAQLAEASWDNANQFGVKNRDAAESMFNELPDNVKKAYGDAKNWYMTQLMIRHKENEIEDSTMTPNAFALDRQKAKEKGDEMAKQFGYDKLLEEMKLGGQKELEKFKANMRNQSHAQQTGALNGIVDSIVNEAVTNQEDTWSNKFFGETYHKLNVSAPTLSAFSKIDKDSDGKNVKTAPTAILVSPDGKKIKTVFADGTIEDAGIDEFKARFGKDILGVSATEKEINADDDNNEDNRSSSSTGSVSPSLKTIPNF